MSSITDLSPALAPERVALFKMLGLEKGSWELLQSVHSSAEKMYCNLSHQMYF